VAAKIAQFWPRAVICGRSALAGTTAVEGALYVSTPDRRSSRLLRDPACDNTVTSGIMCLM